MNFSFFTLLGKKMLEVGRLCVKTQGRDAMQHCVVIEVIDNNYVLVDGNTRRKKVNKSHLEPLTKVLDVKKGADTKTVLAAFEKADIEVKKVTESKAKKEKTEKPVSKKAIKSAEPKKAAKKSEKKK